MTQRRRSPRPLSAEAYDTFVHWLADRFEADPAFAQRYGQLAEEYRFMEKTFLLNALQRQPSTTPVKLAQPY